MELCSNTLRGILSKRRDEFQREKFEVLSHLEYFVSSELFQEILKGVHYLHTLNPPIIHRDLKPTNILITDGANGRFVKLADFGLAVVHDKQTHTQGSGTVKYIAPEVSSGRNYDTKADIYSLGIIIQDLFDIDINKYFACFITISCHVYFIFSLFRHIGENTELETKYENLFYLTEIMTAINYHKINSF